MSTAKQAGAASASTLLLAVALIKPWEGLWLTAKVDTIGTGKPPTVCYGATRAEIPTLKVGDTFDKKYCDNLLLKSAPKYAAAISPCIKVPISDKEYAAYISFSYNVGSAGACRSSAFALLNRGDHRSACQALMNWTRAQGKVVQGLVNRRTAERRLCLEGVNEPATQRVPAPKSAPNKAPTLTAWQKLALAWKYIRS